MCWSIMEHRALSIDDGRRERRFVYSAVAGALVSQNGQARAELAARETTGHGTATASWTTLHHRIVLIH